jgi:hypothetical protein
MKQEERTVVSQNFACFAKYLTGKNVVLKSFAKWKSKLNSLLYFHGTKNIGIQNLTKSV